MNLYAREALSADGNTLAAVSRKRRLNCGKLVGESFLALGFLTLLTGPVYGLSVSNVASSPTQAILAYTAPSAAACTVEVSESATLSPLVHDVDHRLYPGANLDSRAGALASATQRIFVAGTRSITAAADQRKYSRALQQNTLHHYRITCGTDRATGTFMTKILPFGTTHQDLLPMNPDGTYNFPSTSSTDRTEEIVDSQTGVLIRRVNLPSDNAPDSTPWPTAGGFGESCSVKIDSQGFYHCMFNDYPQGIYPNLYALHAATGEVRFLGAAYFFRAELDPLAFSVVGASGGGETVMWDPDDADIVFVPFYVPATGRSTIAKWTYTGADNPGTNIAGEPRQSPHLVADLLGGRDLNKMAAAFDARFDPGKFSCGAVGLQSHYFLLKCPRGYQDTYAWEGVYDMGNGLPLGSGGNGRIVAMAPGWALSGSRWCADHTYEFVGSVPVYSFAVHSLSGLSSPPYDGGGPYAASLLSSVSAASPGALTTIDVSSAWNPSWGPPPASWQAGEPLSPNPDHFLQAVQPGDMFSVDNEFVRLVTKNSASSWVVERGLSDTNAAAHPAQTVVYTGCESANSLLTSSGGYLWWDFLASPNGAGSGDWVMNFGNHPVSRGRYRVDSGYPIRSGAVTDKTTWGKTANMSVTSHPVFGGQSAPGDGNSFQKHASMASGNDLTFFDETYFVGTSLFSAQNSTATSHISGSLYQYHYETGVAFRNGTPLARKHFPTLVKTGGRGMADVSGPGARLSDSTSGNYKYCIANIAGECSNRADGRPSAKGDIFFNHPALDLAHPWCTGAENGTGGQDICIGNFAAMGVAAVQYKIMDDLKGSLSYRPLSRTFQSYDTGLSDNLKLTFGAEWAIFFAMDRTAPPNPATRVFALKVPPVPEDDGIDRGSFVPAPITIVTPQQSGIVSARVRFGYAEQGNPLSYYCTSRREPCLAVAATIDEANPFVFATTDSYKPLPCAAGCTIAIPVYPLHTAYYAVELLNAGGAVVTTRRGVTMEKATVSLDSTTTSHVGGDWKIK